MTMKSAIKIFALIACLPLAAVAQSLRCGGKLISNGTSKEEVAARCGQPTQVEHQTTYEEAATAVPPMGALPPIGARSGAETRVEVWTYNFGPTRLMQRIRFANGAVVTIESLGYGF